MNTKAFLILAGVVCGVLVGTSHATTELREGVLAPAVTAELIDGNTFDSAQLRGKVIVLNFWASWCTPCRKEMPALDTFYRLHHAEGLEMIAISIEDPSNLPKIRDAIKHFSFSVALASGADVEGYGRQSRIPVTFVIDRYGVLRFDGFKVAKTLDLHALDKIVLPLLRDSKGSTVAEGSLSGRTRFVNIDR